MRRVALASVDVCPALPSWAGWALILATIWPALLPAPAQAAEPVKKPAALARYFPRQDLVIYAEFDGFDAHDGLWRKTAAYRVLNETRTGSMLDDIARQLAERILSVTPGQPLTAKELRLVVEHAARNGFALGVVRKPEEPRPSFVGLVLRGAAKGKVRETVEKVMGAGKAPGSKTETLDKPKGRQVVVQSSTGMPGFAWWPEGEDLAFSLASPAGVDLMIEVLDGRRPDATGHPDRAALARSDDGFTPIGLAFLDMGVFPALPPQAASYGFDRVKRVEYRWGFHGEALTTLTRVVAPAPRSGLLAMFDAPAFDRKGLPPLPPGLAGFTSFSADLSGLYDRLAAGFAAANPSARVAFESFEAVVRDVTGYRLRDDILPHLGPKTTYYDVPTRVNAPTNVLAGIGQGLFLTPRATVVIDLKDVNAFSKVLDDSMTKAQAFFKSRAEVTAKPPAVRIHPLKGVKHAYVLSISPTAFPQSAGFRPTFILGKTSLILGSTPEAAQGTLSLDARRGDLPAGDPLSPSLGSLPRGMTFVHVSDERQSLLPEVIANLPGLVRWGGISLMGGPRFLFGRGMAMRDGRLFPLEIDPDRIPLPDDLRPFLFPSVFTLTADEQGFQFTSREAFPAFNPVAVAPIAAALLLPAMQASRSAARRAQSVNNLKQIGLALHNHHSTNERFPPQAITDKDGKPLLSWRVTILPFLEQQDLYNQFKLDEPWDSEHNKPLIARMPAVFAIPGAAAEPGKTFYRGFSGPSTLFDPKVKEGVGIATVVDGTSNTIGIVEARKAVIWTKPDEEIPFDAAKPEKAKDLPPALGGHFPGGFNALFLDGSVRFLKETINLNVLRALITRDGGEVIGADAF
jgi:prepilin-type processing-associated H-X9-DG protein